MSSIVDSLTIVSIDVDRLSVVVSVWRLSDDISIDPFGFDLFLVSFQIERRFFSIAISPISLSLCLSLFQRRLSLRRDAKLLHETDEFKLKSVAVYDEAYRKT